LDRTDVRIRWIIAILIVLDYQPHDIDAKPVYALVQPEPQYVVHCHSNSGIAPVQIRLLEFLAGGFIDELFLTVAPQIAGRDAVHPRPGLVANVQFSPATAPWWKLISAKSATDYLFLRYQVDI